MTYNKGENMNIDIEKLREDLIDYFGTASFYNKMAMIDLIKVEKASDDELIHIAIKNGFDLAKYQIAYRK